MILMKKKRWEKKKREEMMGSAGPAHMAHVCWVFFVPTNPNKRKDRREYDGLAPPDL